MSWTKGGLVDEAYAELALAGWVFDLDPEERAMGLRRLDAMLATWEAKGIKLGYSTGGKLDDESGLPDMAIETVYTNLALRLAAAKGKQVLPTTHLTASAGYETLLWKAAMPPEQQLSGRMPMGAGNKPWRRSNRPFMPPPDDSPLANTPGGDLDILE